MPIRDWPSDERPREKLLEKGAATLSDAELIAILLCAGMPRRSVLDLARAAQELKVYFHGPFHTGQTSRESSVNRRFKILLSEHPLTDDASAQGY